MLHDDSTIFLRKLDNYLHRFTVINEEYKKGNLLKKEIEIIIAEFTDFILDKENEKIWKNFDILKLNNIQKTIGRLRKESAYSVCIMEKIRADLLLNKENLATDYFNNIEKSIENEFRDYEITNNSKVLFIGIGSFPMTPLYLSKTKGAHIIGIDIDEEAVRYAQKIIKLLGENLKIDVSLKSYKDIQDIDKITHIIIASTIAEKFDILSNLYSITNNNVVVSMRYGNGLKSLFNYPLLDIDKNKWIIVDNQIREDSVFDIAIYKKGVDFAAY